MKIFKLLKEKLRQFRLNRKYKEKIKELKKRDPFIYK
jgi:hypothetical protein